MASLLRISHLTPRLGGAVPMLLSQGARRPMSTFVAAATAGRMRSASATGVGLLRFAAGRTQFQVARFTNRPLSGKQQMVGVVTKMKTHSGAKKRFAVTGTGKVQFRHASRYHKMYTKSKSAKSRLLRRGYLKTTQARRVLSMLPYQLGRAKLLQRRALVKRLNRQEMETASLRLALEKQHPPEFFTKESKGQKLALVDHVVELPERLQRHLQATDSFIDPFTLSYASTQSLTLPLRTDPGTMQKMLERARAHQIVVQRALRGPKDRRHRWQPLKTEGVPFPPTYTPTAELARQRSQREAHVLARQQREIRTREAMLKRHQADQLRAKMIAQHA